MLLRMLFIKLLILNAEDLTCWDRLAGALDDSRWTH